MGFSQQGFNLTHATGKRRGHSTLLVEQKVCSRYPDRLATCEVNGEYYSDEAYDEAIKEDPDLKKAPKKVLGGLKCSEYPNRVAEVLVEKEAQELIDRCRMIADGDPWCAFRDDNLNTYWYHWADKVTTSISPFRNKGLPAKS